MDFEVRLKDSLARGVRKVAENLLNTDLSIEQIAAATGLTCEEIELLRG